MSLVNKDRSSKSFFQFLKYGIGEIILVVLGILIAVSINNCNEKRKQEIELKNIYSAVKENLENDIAEIDTMLMTYEERKPWFDKILNDELGRKDYEETWWLGYIIMGFPELTIDQRGYNLLQEFISTSGSHKEDLASKIIEFYTERLNEIGVDDEIRREDFNNNFYYWKNNYPWWQEYLMDRKMDGFLEYALVDQDYKNRVATHKWLTYQIFLPELVEFRERALKLLEEIELNIAK